MRRATRAVGVALGGLVLAGITPVDVAAQACLGSFGRNNLTTTTGFLTPGLENRQDARSKFRRSVVWNGDALAESDLELTNVDAPDAVTAGETLTYELTVTNESPCPATDLTIEDPLPAGTTFVSAVAAVGTCTTPAVGEAGSVSCHFAGPITGSRSATVTVAVAPSATGTLSNVVTVDSAPPDPDGGREASATTAVVAEADLGLVKNADAEVVTAGSPVTYTLLADNHGPSTALDVVVSDTLPAGTTFVSVAADGATCTTPAVGASGTVSCTFAGATDPGQVRTVEIVARVDAEIEHGAEIANTAGVSSAVADPDGFDDRATAVALAQQHVLVIPVLSPGALALLALLLLAAGLLAVRHHVP